MLKNSIHTFVLKKIHTQCTHFVVVKEHAVIVNVHAVYTEVSAVFVEIHLF